MSRIADMREQMEFFLDRHLDTDTKKLVAKLCFGAGVGAAATFVSYKLYLKILDLRLPYKKTLTGDTTSPVKVTLIHRDPVTTDARRLRFSLPTAHHSLGIPPGNSVNVSAKLNGKTLSEDYTPITGETDLGHMDLIIKLPAPSTMPNEMAMSQYLDKLKIGEQVLITGPHGLLAYQGEGRFSIKADKKASASVVKQVRRVAMIAGGAGLTAMFPVLSAILKENGDFPKCSLVYANKSEQDILLRDDLKSLASKHRNRFMLWYMLDKPSPGWKYGAGPIDEQVIVDWMPKPGPEILILLCGPELMVATCKAVLHKLNYSADMIFSF